MNSNNISGHKKGKTGATAVVVAGQQLHTASLHRETMQKSKRVLLQFGRVFMPDMS